MWTSEDVAERLFHDKTLIPGLNTHGCCLCVRSVPVKGIPTFIPRIKNPPETCNVVIFGPKKILFSLIYVM